MRTLIMILVLALAAPAVRAEGLAGTWERTNGKARFRIAPCGPDMCAVIVWIRPDVKKGKLGQTAFRTLSQTGDNSWSGEAYNPENGRTYKGTARLDGDILHVKGCALGMFCKSDTWKRIN